MNKYNRVWINRIWEHQNKYKINPLKYRYVSKSIAIKATILLILNLWKDGPSSYSDFDENKQVAWKNEGCYHTDFGIGYAFSVLCVDRFCVYEYQDGSL